MISTTARSAQDAGTEARLMMVWMVARPRTTTSMTFVGVLLLGGRSSGSGRLTDPKTWLLRAAMVSPRPGCRRTRDEARVLLVVVASRACLRKVTPFGVAEHRCLLAVTVAAVSASGGRGVLKQEGTRVPVWVG
jgi:hypothetical protein